MLKQEQAKHLEENLGMNIEQLKAALTSDEEVEITLKSGILLDDEQLEGIKNSKKSEGYNEGKIAGVEIKAKEVKEKFGIEVEGKDFDKIFETYGAKVLETAKIEPTKKVQELTTSISNLQKQYETDIADREKRIASLEGEKNEIKSINELATKVPNGLKGIKNDQFITLVRTEYDFKFDDNGNQVVLDKQGNVLKDKLEKPIPVSDVLTEYATKNQWYGADGRGGQSDSGSTGTFETMNDVYKHMETNKIDPMSAEGKKLIETFKNNQ